MLGHKHAVAELRLVYGGTGAATAVWPGRRLTLGRSPFTALPLENAALASRCHAVVDWDEATRTAWLTDCSTHGVLVLSRACEGQPAPEELEGLPWDSAEHMRAATARLQDGALIVVGLHGAEWLGAVRHAGFLQAVEDTGACVLLYSELGGAAAAGSDDPAAPPFIQPRLPFARTPAKPAGDLSLLAINTQAARHERIREKYGSARPKTGQLPVQCYNLVQLAQALAAKGLALGRKVAKTKGAAGQRVPAAKPARGGGSLRRQLTKELQEEEEEEGGAELGGSPAESPLSRRRSSRARKAAV